jgi:preprotein translocase subunit YajC
MMNQTFESSLIGSLIMLGIIGIFIFVLTRPKEKK